MSSGDMNGKHEQESLGNELADLKQIRPQSLSSGYGEEDDGFYTAASLSFPDFDIPEGRRMSSGDVLVNHEQESLDDESADLKQTEFLSSGCMETDKVEGTHKILLQTLEDESHLLREKLGVKEWELLSNAETHKHEEEEASVLIRELKEQLDSKKLELGTVDAVKREMEECLESKVTTSKQLQLENLKLQSEVQSLEDRLNKNILSWSPVGRRTVIWSGKSR